MHVSLDDLAAGSEEKCIEIGKMKIRKLYSLLQIKIECVK